MCSRVQLYFPSRTAHRPSGGSQICRDFQAYLNVVIFKERLYEDSAFLNSPCSPASVQWVPAISSNMEGVCGRAQGRLCDQRSRGERGVSILINIYGHTRNWISWSTFWSLIGNKIPTASTTLRTMTIKASRSCYWDLCLSRTEHPSKSSHHCTVHASQISVLQLLRFAHNTQLISNRWCHITRSHRSDVTREWQSKVFLLSQQTRKKKKIMQAKEGIRMCGQQELLLQWKLPAHIVVQQGRLVYKQWKACVYAFWQKVKANIVPASHKLHKKTGFRELPWVTAKERRGEGESRRVSVLIGYSSLPATWPLWRPRYLVYKISSRRQWCAG